MKFLKSIGVDGMLEEFVEWELGINGRSDALAELALNPQRAGFYPFMYCRLMWNVDLDMKKEQESFFADYIGRKDGICAEEDLKNEALATMQKQNIKQQLLLVKIDKLFFATQKHIADKNVQSAFETLSLVKKLIADNQDLLKFHGYLYTRGYTKNRCIKDLEDSLRELSKTTGKTFRKKELDTAVFAKLEFVRLSEKEGKPALVIGIKNEGLINGLNGKVKITKKPDDWQMQEEGGIEDLVIDGSALIYLPVSKLGKDEINNFTVEISDQNGKKLEGSGTVKIARAVKIPKDSIKMDGNASEWKDIAGLVLNKSTAMVNYKTQEDINKTWQDDHDLSALIKVCYDDDNVYVLAEVRDDRVFMDSEIAGQLAYSLDNIFMADCLELFFDTQLKRDFLDEEYNGDDVQLLIAPIAENNPQDRIAKGGEANNADVSKIEVKSEKTKDGYNLEIKMPIKTVFPQLKMKPGLLIGFNAAIDDDDVPGYHQDMTGQRLGRELQIGWKSGHKPVTAFGALIFE